MKNRNSVSLLILIVVIITYIVTGFKFSSRRHSTGTIYLYGEMHSNPIILEKEFELWNSYYHNHNMRHLFIEMPYYSAMYLNSWMKEGDDKILETLFSDLEGTEAYSNEYKAFFKLIKEKTPNTIFHGTDIGHQFNTTGNRYLNDLKDLGLEESDEYREAKRVIEQGKAFYQSGEHNNIYRENMMVENFIRAFDKVENEDVMGIYGGAHTDIDGTVFGTTNKPNMAKQLKVKYTNQIYSTDLSWLGLITEPLKIETLIVNGKEYQASYFGKETIGLEEPEYTKVQFWRLDDAYQDFTQNRIGEFEIEYANFPMMIEKFQVYVLELTKHDGSIDRLYFKSDGSEWKATHKVIQFLLE